MNKFLSIITGVFIGGVVSAVLIFQGGADVAYSVDSGSWWNDFVASADSADFNWNSVFNPFSPSEKAKNLYNLTYKKLNRGAENRALKDVAASYGLTTNEAQAVIGGSIVPIFNNPNRKGLTLSQEDARIIMSRVQENYSLLRELYQIQEEVDIATKPSELFANGDVADSGFDLIHDLSVIEEILFFEKTPSSVGGLYADSLASPYNPVEADATFENYLSPYQELSKLPISVKNADGEAGEGVGIYYIGEEEKSVSVLEGDVCESPNHFSEALDDYDAGAGGGGEGGGDAGGGGNDGGAGDAWGGGGIGGVGGDENNEADAGDAAKKIKPAPADDWLTAWCLGQDSAPEFPGVLPEVVSLGGASNSYLDDGSNPGNGKPFSADVSLCLDIKLLKGHAASYQPGQSCVNCEVEKINQYLEKTLSHSLIPNKATGNLLESAKCKDTGTLFNMQFVTIWNPIPAPENDDIIFGKNIFEEWNKFVENYQPLLLGKLALTSENRPEQSDNHLLEVMAKTSPGGTSQSELFDQVNNIKNKYSAEAALSVDNFRKADTAGNVALYLRDVLAEIQEMNALFNNYNNIYTNIDKNALSPTLEKESK